MPPPADAAGRRTPPVASAANFRVRVDGEEVGVSHVRGIGWVAGDDAGAAGARLTLRRAVTGDSALYAWLHRHDGRGRGREVVVELWDAGQARPVAAWALVDARPTRWSGPELDALAGGVAYEELELAYTRLEWRFPEPGGER